VVAGGPDTSDAAYLALLIDGALLLFGLLALLHALVWRFPPVVAGPVVGLLLIGTLFHRPDDGYAWSSPFGLAIGLALSLLLISLIVYWRLPAGTGWAAGPAMVVGVVALVVSVGGVLLLAQPATFEPSAELTSTVLVTAFAALACFALLSAVAPVPSPIQEGSGATSMAKEKGLPVAGSPPPSVAYTQPPSSYGTSRDRAELTPALAVTLAVVVAVVAGTGRWTLLDSALGLFSLGLLATSVRASVAVLRTPTLWVLAGAGGFSLTVVAGFFLQLWAPPVDVPDQMDPLSDVLLPATWLVATLILALVLNVIRRSRQVKRSAPPRTAIKSKTRPSIGEVSDNTVVLSDGPTIAIDVPPRPKE